MSNLILHHYASSPYAEKTRSLLGFKKLAWKSVDIPTMLPKPDVVALTGGYRKTPVLQLGRDIYCDTRLIAHVLERLQPTPPLFPTRSRASCSAFLHLEQVVFFAGIAVGISPEGAKFFIEAMGADQFEEFGKDRAGFFTGGTVPRPHPDFAVGRFEPLMGALDSQLAEQPFLLGASPTIADFAMYHGVWFVRVNPGVAHRLDPYPHLLAWADRIRAFGHGTRTEIPSSAALEVAQSTRTQQPFEGDYLALPKIALGQKLSIGPTDYGIDRVEGTLVHASLTEIAIARTDPRAGDVVVHFPRIDYRVLPAD
ncbi:glutathione S-transferase family protein [Pendulispora rubella]|uniref:Glutathione S-transferase family protein n=1 Tax=Pendulispora rubella TaxID=2741070 RepID=A0ABZ2L4C0_9BACT